MRNTKIGSALLALVAVLSWAEPTSGQLPGASPATLGTANNYMVLARGFAAIGLNPAGLGMPETSGFTLSIFPAGGSQSLDPLTLSDFADYEGVVVPSSVKQDWLQKISAAGGQSGAATLEVTPFSASWNNFGLQLSTIVSGRADLNDAAAELLLFGNAGRTGAAGDFELQGSGLTAFAVTTLGISVGVPIARRWVPGLKQGLSVGVTLKQSWGHALAFAEDRGTVAIGDPVGVEVDFPVIQPADNSGGWNRGSGLGLDVGVAWERGPWAAAAAIQNLFNTFKWDLAKLSYRPGEAVFDENTNQSNFDEFPATVAPLAIKAKVKELTFKPALSLGGAFQASETFTVTAELRQRVEDGLETGPKSHLGIGMEFRPTPVVPLRAGFAVVTKGYQVGGGMGLVLGPVHLGFAGLYQSGDVGDGLAGSFGISIGGG